MNTTSPHVLLLETIAVLQFGVAVLNLFLVRLLHWRDDLSRMPLLLRQVFRIHAWFISITLTIFAVLTWRFAWPMAAGVDAVCRWLAAGIGLFWAIRTILQVTYYSSSHWRGRLGRTVVHVTLLIGYGAFSVIYFWSAFHAALPSAQP